jgi:triosephosphate isomerase
MKKIIAGNWKFNKELRNSEKAISFVEELEERIKEIKNVEVKVFPHDSVLAPLAKRVKRIKLGSQDIHWEEDGSFTGAHFSGRDLISLGVKEVLIGHSETRAYFGVTDERVALKLKSAFENGILPTICLGEDIEEKERGETERVLRKQIEKGILPGLKENSKFLIAYEPIYAIAGFAKLRGKEPKPAKIEDIKFSHQTIREIFSKNEYPEVKILYGGSSSPQNARELLAENFIDGLLIGTASWNLDSFFKIIKIANVLR